MSGILSALGPKAWKAVIAGIIAGLGVLSAQLDAGAAIDLFAILKAAGGALIAHQAVFWKANG